MSEPDYIRRVFLPAPAERIFEDLLDPEHVAAYDSHFQAWQPRSLPLAVGTRVDFRSRVGPFWMNAVSEFAAFDPPRHLEIRLVSPPSPIRSRLTWDLEPDAGGTWFTYHFVLDGPRGTGWIRRRMLGLFTAHLDEELPALARRYEDRVGAGGHPPEHREAPPRRLAGPVGPEHGAADLLGRGGRVVAGAESRTYPERT